MIEVANIGDGLNADPEADVAEPNEAEGHMGYLVSFPHMNPNPIIEVDFSGGVTFLNPAAQRVLQNLGMGNGDSKAFLPEDLNAILRDWDKKNELVLHRETAIRDRIFDETVCLVPQLSVARIYAFDITERKKAVTHLRESEERYRVAIESSNDGVALFRGPGLIYGNQRFLDMFGYDSLEEAQHMDRFLRIHPEDREMVARYTARRQRGEPAPSSYECKGIGKNGAIMHLEVSVASVIYLGEPASLAYLRDVTERKRVEEAFYASRLQLSEAMDLAHIVYWESDPAAQTYVFNDPFYAFYGTTAEQEGGYRMTREDYAQRFIHPDDLPLYYQSLEKNTLRRGPESVADMEHRIIRRDGEVRHILARIRVIKDDSGCIVKRYGANQDITERKEAEESLKRSEATLRSLIDATREAVLLVDREGGILIANETAAERLGTRVGDLVGTCLYDYFPPKLAELRRERFERVIRTGEPVCFQDERSDRSYETYGYPVVDKKRTVTALAIFARDITERKNLEAQLRQAQKMEAIGTLAGGVAHDFNNILTVIIGFANLIQMGIDKDDLLRPYVHQIVASSERAADLTQSLLAFSRKQRITLEPQTVNGVVASTAKLLRRLLPEDIEIAMNLTDEDAFSLLDVTQIGQILMNLATNARDAMPHGGSLTITTERARLDENFKKAHGFGQPGEYVRLSVSDTGTGMDERTMERIFEPFFTTKELGKGTGLGLASAYGIVKQHNGYITVSSRPLEGATLDLYLPLIDTPHPREGVSAAEEIERGTETILIVEDDRDVRNMLTRILESHGYTTIEAIDGNDAIRLHHEHREKVDLIMLDVVMPGKNGKEALREITHTDPRVKALFMSGYTGDIVFEKGIYDVAVDFLPKPFTPNKLLQKVREVLDRQHS